MSEKIKSKIGEELYNKILETGIKSEDIDIVNDGTYVPRSRLNEVTGKLKANEDKVKSFQKQLDETKSMLEGNEEYKTKYEDLNNKYVADLEQKDKEILNTSKKFLIEQHLNNNGAKHTDLLMSKIELDKISIENNNLLGFDDTFNKLKTDYNDLFVEKQTKSNTQNTNSEDSNDSGGDDTDDWDSLLKEI